MVLRVGLVGAGGITQSHVKGWATVADRAEIVAIADVSEEAARLRMKQIGREVKYYADYNEMFAAKDIDAVDLALPHFLHCPSIVAAAKAGKHAMSEKPFCLSRPRPSKSARPSLARAPCLWRPTTSCSSPRSSVPSR
jgi:predicted dehydrogenase